MASPEGFSSILSSISNDSTSLANQNAGAPEQLLSLAYKLAAAVGTPSESIQRTGWAEVGSLISPRRLLLSAHKVPIKPLPAARHAAMQLAVDLKKFDELAENNDKAVKTAELAKQTGAVDVLIGRHDDTAKLRKQWKTNDVPKAARTRKHLAAMNDVSESSAGTHNHPPPPKPSENGDSRRNNLHVGSAHPPGQNKNQSLTNAARVQRRQLLLSPHPHLPPSNLL
jgi:hypothetical protein